MASGGFDLNSPEIRYEEYRQRFRITEWRDGCVYRTEPLDTGWFPQDDILDNKPGETNIIYAAASDEYSKTHSTIRRMKRDDG